MVQYHIYLSAAEEAFLARVAHQRGLSLKELLSSIISNKATQFRLKRGLPLPPEKSKYCSVPSCNSLSFAGGLCSIHYQRERRKRLKGREET